MNKIDQILFEMPGQFSKSDWIDAVARTGYSYKYANSALEKLLESGKIKVNDSVFQKCENLVDLYI